MGYAEAPWNFKGRALYQLQLVRAEEARKYIPHEFKLVECLGWTLGGVYLARYEDSPVGAFDECVVMAGLVWNPPTSCAWAGRVYVSDRDARDHGLAHVGLPSRLAAFAPAGAAGAAGGRSWWRKGAGAAGAAPSSGAGLRLPGGFVDAIELRSAERGRRALPAPVATFKLPPLRTEGFLGPRLRLSLPSFSGGTAEHPQLLQYSCDLQTSVMPVAPMTIELHHGGGGGAQEEHARQGGEEEGRRRERGGWWWQARRREPERAAGGGGGEVLDALLCGRPLVALAFSDMVVRGRLSGALAG
ncbi:MAG: hypothetical protein J3K34DRAFT_16564 [Monoraphidium minutum]|nr:MAG: hypothetical protein J3K34DRAFT_16564 [Monoraphidium minutum]